MSKPKVCPQCTKPIPDTAPDGVCPACLIQMAVDLSSTTKNSNGAFEPPAVADLRDQFAQLEVLELLGCGGMSAVYRARQKMLKREVAIKILPPERARDPEFTERFLREARALAKLTHPHIVSVYDAGQSGNYLYIVMEYVDGATLRALIKEGKLSPAESMNMVRQICDGMQYAHDRGVIHRDIKPENVLIDLQGQIKITDFGLAKLNQQSSAAYFPLTETSVRMGTAHYMSPEQYINTAAVDHRADIYSLGVMFYEMLTGELPTLEFKPPSHKIDVDPRVDQVVERSIKAFPAERYQQAAEVRNDVERIAATPRRSMRFIVTALGLVLAGVLSAVIWNWQQGGSHSIAAAPQSAKPRQAEKVTTAGWHGWPLDAPSPARVPFNSDQARKHQEEWAEYLKVPVEYDNFIGMKFRLLPPGEFMMGSTPEEIDETNRTVERGAHWQECVKSEAPRHKVVLTQPIYVAVTEVTQAQYETIMGWNPAQFKINSRDKQSAEKVRDLDTSSHAVEWVTWNDAADFCAKISYQEQFNSYYLKKGDSVTRLEGNGYRLLTEAEWEFACRAGTTSRYWVGDQEGQLLTAGWIGTNSEGRTHAVAELQSNPFGLFDVHGNVFEWVEDAWYATYYGQFADSPAINPVAKTSQDPRHVFRGGMWASAGLSSRSASRYAFSPTELRNGVGFRVALEVDAVRQAVHRPPEKVVSHQWPENAPRPAIAPFNTEQAAQHQREWAEHLKLPVEYGNGLGMKFRLIPPGEFLMGSSEQEIEETFKAITTNKGWRACVKSEAPRHKVILTQPFYIGTTEVTQSQYERITGQNPARFGKNTTDKRTAEKINGLDTSTHPVELVSWNEAADFCVKLSQQEQLKPSYFRTDDNVVNLNGNGYRFPTEAEWEFACRAGTTTKYWIGDRADQLATVGWIGANSGGRTHAVAELPANPFGLFDVHGNVWEWVEDAWVPTVYRRFAEQPVIDPIVRSSVGSSHPLRGGYWGSVAPSCRSASHHADYPIARYDLLGFRVALSVDSVRQAINRPPVKVTSDRAQRVKDLFDKSLTASKVVVSADRPASDLSDAELVLSHVLTSPDWEWSEPVQLLYEDESIKSYAPDVSVDGLHLVFTTEQPPDNRAFVREMRRAAANEAWGAPTSMASHFPTLQTFGGPCLTRDGTALLFNSPDSHPAASGSDDLWMATRKSVSDQWSDAAPIGNGINSRGRDWCPFMTNDGLTLTWAADRALTGKTDLWMARRASVNEPFGEPESLGTKVNTPAMENNPKVTPDDRVLVFASGRNDPAGPLILFLSVREHRDAPWSTPINPGRPINLPGSDSHATIAPDGRTMIFSRYGYGKATLWTTQRVPKKSVEGAAMDK